MFLVLLPIVAFSIGLVDCSYDLRSFCIGHDRVRERSSSVRQVLRCIQLMLPIITTTSKLVMIAPMGIDDDNDENKDDEIGEAGADIRRMGEKLETRDEELGIMGERWWKWCH